MQMRSLPKTDGCGTFLTSWRTEVRPTPFLAPKMLDAVANCPSFSLTTRLLMAETLLYLASWNFLELVGRTVWDLKNYQ